MPVTYKISGRPSDCFLTDGTCWIVYFENIESILDEYGNNKNKLLTDKNEC